MTVTMECPEDRAKVCKVCIRDKLVFESNPEVGSSKNKIDGLMTSSLATATRLRSPPEIPRRVAPPTTECCTLSNPRSCKVACTNEWTCSSEILCGVLRRAAYQMFS
mmetsp:Transcript_15970/g.20875  ORF Transcript_15970/g.20875 Transcript_15970/m.20875 type:complete len:107 (+) Transcript_15970:567-887(+)